MKVQGLGELHNHLSALMISCAASSRGTACSRGTNLILIPEEATSETAGFMCFKQSTAGAEVAAGCPTCHGWEVKVLWTLPNPTLSATVLLAGEASSCWLPWPDRGGDNCGRGCCIGMGREVKFGSTHRFFESRRGGVVLQLYTDGAKLRSQQRSGQHTCCAGITNLTISCR